jgi:transcriptional regulator of acetoin/glycerol metabolism
MVQLESHEIIEEKFLSSVKKDLIQLEDYMELIPLFGRKKSIKLMRVHYDIHSDPELDFSQNQTQLKIPCFPKELYKFQLIYHSFNQNDENGYFVLKSRSQTPFLINGNISFSSVILRGDRILLGHNVLEFREKTSLSSLRQVQEHQNIGHMAKTNLNILIEGETGTGKTYLAKQIHEASGVMGPFVHINISSFSQNLVESELFGHIKGAFTGANQDKRGAISMANNGTLFLDEIDSLPLSLQTKLLIFLDNKKYRPVGADGEKSSNTRFIFASGKNLKLYSQNSTMRNDFYYRISSGFKLELPPLRKDPEKIKQLCLDYALKHQILIESKLIKFYQKLKWPGNIRQLNSHLEKKLALCKEKKLSYNFVDEALLEIHSIKDFVDGYDKIINFRDLKKQYILKAYQHCNGNLNNTSKCLQMSVKTIKRVVEEKVM